MKSFVAESASSGQESLAARLAVVLRVAVGQTWLDAAELDLAYRVCGGRAALAPRRRALAEGLSLLKNLPRVSVGTGHACLLPASVLEGRVRLLLDRYESAVEAPLLATVTQLIETLHVMSEEYPDACGLTSRHQFALRNWVKLYATAAPPGLQPLPCRTLDDLTKAFPFYCVVGCTDIDDTPQTFSLPAATPNLLLCLAANSNRASRGDLRTQDKASKTGKSKRDKTPTKGCRWFRQLSLPKDRS